MTSTLADSPTTLSHAPSCAASWSVDDLDAPLGALVTGIDARRPLRAEHSLLLDSHFFWDLEHD